MGSLVPFKGSVFGELFVANIALEVLSLMHLFHMLFQPGLAIEHLIAHGAMETVLSGMVEHMRTKLRRLDEFFAADVAHMWTDAGVDFRVPI